MNKYETPAAVGGSSLLVVLAVLSLVVFALLGCATVQADGRLSAVSAQAVADYYRADAQAEEILAQLREGNIPKGVTQQGEQYQYECPVSQNQVLRVVVEITEDGYEVLQWSVYAGSDWERGDQPEVWDGVVK